MSTQSTMTLETKSSLDGEDLATLIESRKSPGIVILNGLGEVLHLNDAAWEILTVLRQHGSAPEHGLMPKAITDLCEELQSKIKGHHTGPARRRLEIMRLLGTAGEGVLLRGSVFEGGVDSPSEQRRFLIVLDHIAEQTEKSSNGKDRFGLTDRECEVAHALTKGLTNKEIGNALGITEPTVKAHIKHMMEKMKCTTRTAIVSQLAGYSIETSSLEH